MFFNPGDGKTAQGLRTAAGRMRHGFLVCVRTVVALVLFSKKDSKLKPHERVEFGILRDSEGLFFRDGKTIAQIGKSGSAELVLRLDRHSPSSTGPNAMPFLN